MLKMVQLSPKATPRRSLEGFAEGRDGTGDEEKANLFSTQGWTDWADDFLGKDGDSVLNFPKDI